MLAPSRMLYSQYFSHRCFEVTNGLSSTAPTAKGTRPEPREVQYSNHVDHHACLSSVACLHRLSLIHLIMGLVLHLPQARDRLVATVFSKQITIQLEPRRE